ncbi:hypothetical protein PSN45_001906 [Yamadazyma tenuis]|nr:hypothetical protein PSN45_001906 [Yamadazyma tenuis]
MNSESLPLEPPHLTHLWNSDDSIISSIIAPLRKRLICGTQNGKILIYSLEDYTHLETLSEPEMTGSNLCLSLTEDEKYLFTAGSDSLIKIYDLSSERIQCIKIIYSSIDIGDIFSIYYCEFLKHLFIGCQNASIVWCKVDFSNVDYAIAIDRNNLPHLRYNKFFDSTGPGGKVSTQAKEINFLKEISLCEVETINSVSFAHFGYIYNLRVFTNEFLLSNFPQYSKILISGGGDGLINIWGIQCDPQTEKLTLSKVESLHNEESILSMHINQTYLYAGLSSGVINVWDLLTFQMIKSFSTPNNEQVNALVTMGQMIIYGNKLGLNLIYNRRVYKLNSDPILTLYSYEYRPDDQIALVAGGKKVVTLYNMVGSSERETIKTFKGVLNNDMLVKNLKKFISYKTISKYPELCMDDSRNCTKFLIKLFDSFGAKSTHLIPIDNGNPIIISTFKNTSNSKNAKRLLYYGHYDVVEAEERNNWSVNPFELTNKNGYLYGRGSSDNKGPTLAIIHAIAELFESNELDVDFTFVIEGEEENGSKQFKETVLENLDLIGDIDWILLSNSYWLDDERPCLNYGLRGVINCSIQVESDHPDRHSGVHGGVCKEPTMDLVQVLNTLSDPVTNEILIPNFYDNINESSPKELEFFDKIVSYNPKFRLDELIAQWTKPSFTIHKIEVSGPNNDTIIPKTATASVSMRIVPNQEVNQIKDSLINFLTDNFTKLNSTNKIDISISHEVEPWLGDVENTFYKVLYANLQKNWEIEPLLIREGGSIPSIRFLEKTLNAPACQIPCGQSSDNAHLQDEKLRFLNLVKLKDVVKDSIHDLSK